MENTTKGKTEVQLKNIFGPIHNSQRGYFSYYLFLEMARNKNIWLLVGDLGWGVFDKHLKYFPERVKNCGASEGAMVGIAVGLAQEGKIPFVYTISSFFMRAAETITLYLHHEGANVKLVGSGRDDDYKHDGFSHYAGMIQYFIHTLNIEELYPDTKEEIPLLVKKMVKSTRPYFISLKR